MIQKKETWWERYLRAIWRKDGALALTAMSHNKGEDNHPHLPD
jgi:hypothetical protein